MLLKAIYQGNVQGVFFRSTIKSYAIALGLVGYAKNLNNKDVEVVAVGEKHKLDELLNKIKNNPGQGSIKNVFFEFFKEDQKFLDFKIL